MLRQFHKISSQLAKLPQYKGEELLGNAFRSCDTPESDRILIRNLDKPSLAQAVCTTQFFWSVFGLIKEDRTLDVEKIMQQFVDYEIHIPEDTKTLKNINVDTQKEELALITFKWLGNNKEAIRLAYYGKGETAFTFQ